MSKTPKINIYTCEYGCQNITVDVDEGVTPFMIKCVREADKDRPLKPEKSKDGVCIGTAKSNFYPTKGVPTNVMDLVKHEWYSPKESERMTLSELEMDHVNQGGLLMRKRTDRKPLFHKDNV